VIFFIQNLACGGCHKVIKFGLGRKCQIRTITLIFTVMASKMWAHSPQKWYFFDINLSLRENHGVNRKLEYRCTTINLPLWNVTLIVLKITLFHSVSIITNFVIPKRDRQTKTSHFLVYSRCATHDPHHSRHGDKGGQCYFCTPITFLI